MKKVIVIPNPSKDEGLKVTGAVLNKLFALGFTPYLERKYSAFPLSGAEVFDLLPSDAEFIVVIGGDGSVIDASRVAVELDIPLLGVNLGKVGYLVEVDPDRLDKLELLVSGEYEIEEKMLLSVKKYSVDGEEEHSARFAVNDVVVSHDNYFGISDFMVENQREDHVRFRADGVIVSTPQGSTAYSLSAGGPIISHTLDSITVTPVCPHSFFNRAIVYGPEEKIKISNSERSVLNVSIDGRLFTRLEMKEYCVVEKSDKRLKTVSFGESNVFSTLSKKIKSLQDIL